MTITNEERWKVLAECGPSQAQLADTIIQQRRAIHAVEAALAELQGGEHATNGRDFGRGVAHAASVIAAALADASMWADPITVFKYGTVEPT